jgi:lauroyl/myristoyl acyltransferase
MSKAHAHAWEAQPMAWYQQDGQWFAVYRCQHCPALDPRPVPGPGELPA